MDYVLRYFDANNIEAFAYNLEARYSGIVDIINQPGGSISFEDLEYVARIEFAKL